MIALRLTNFLTDQRTKFKLFVIAALLCLLSINIETTNNDGRWQPCLESAQFLKVNNNLKDTCINVKVNNNLKDTCINVKKFATSKLHKVNNNQEVYINQKKFAMDNVQHSVREGRQQEFL